METVGKYLQEVRYSYRCPSDAVAGIYVQRGVGFDALHVVGSPTAVLQSGHVQDCESNQRSMHSTWKRCVHGSTRSVSPGSYSSRHTQQLDPELPPHDLTMRS